MVEQNVAIDGEGSSSSNTSYNDTHVVYTSFLRATHHHLRCVAAQGRRKIRRWLKRRSKSKIYVVYADLHIIHIHAWMYEPRKTADAVHTVVYGFFCCRCCCCRCLLPFYSVHNTNGLGSLLLCLCVCFAWAFNFRQRCALCICLHTPSVC